MISKSKYIEGLNCEKSLWLDINHPEIEKSEESSLASEYGNQVGACARKYFPDCKLIERKTNKQMVEDTQKLLEQDNVTIAEASFIYNGLFCSVDILVKKGNIYQIYEVKSKKEPNKSEKEKFINDISFQYYILSNLGMNITNAYLMGINPNYIRHGKINLKELFKTEDLTNTVIDLQPFVKEKVKEMEIYISKDKCEKEIGNQCKDCGYFGYCTSKLPRNNIFELNSRLTFSKKIELYNKGIIEKKDALSEKLSDNVIEQIRHDIYDLEDYIDTESITNFLDQLKGDVYFLDFETYSNAIPEYDGDVVNETIPFQFSLHYYKDGKLYHDEFLGDGVNDPRRILAEQLVKMIPTNVKVIAYHKSVECGIIKKLANRFKDLSEPLNKIANNVVDLEEPFSKRYYYSRGLNGRSSIKVVLPVMCPELNYSALDGVHKGDEATNTYLNLKNLTEEEKEKLRTQLLTYCSLDTFAMVRILEELNKIVYNVDEWRNNEKRLHLSRE